ncbi:MAG TPA: iron-containing alcohol dehydrogenase [Anaerolineae bacterium]|nr:iron-containing alcohol dehydrogenase [Anaerolineae bacterium]
MWYFDSPHVIFGEEALIFLAQLTGRHAFVITDHNIVQLGLAQLVVDQLITVGLTATIFDEVEPEPSLQMVQRCALALAEQQPDWIIGLGGGSCMDAAKAAWLLYENPGIEPASVNPFDQYTLRAKAKLIAIPTTSGTGSEATWYAVLTDTVEQRKVGVGTRGMLPDYAIIDPVMVMSLPQSITADTGLDALTQSIESYQSTWRNDFSDALCLHAVRLIFENLPRVYADGSDREAREHMHNAATIGGIGFGNSQATLAHCMGHALGALFHIPHGRAVALFLPYTIEFTANGGGSRYADIAKTLGLRADAESIGAANLVSAVRDLERKLHQPLTVSELGIDRAAFDQVLPDLVMRAETDTQIATSQRIPDSAELQRLFDYAYTGRSVDF